MGCSCYANIPFNEIFIKISMKTSIVVDKEGVMTFSEEMLSWSRGPRATDGNWGKYWYKNVMNSTGFNEYKSKEEEVPENYEQLYHECYTFYEKLHHLRLK